MKPLSARNAAWAAAFVTAGTAAALAPMIGGDTPVSAPAIGQAGERKLPAPPTNGVMGFVIDSFVPPIVPGMEQCGGSTSPKVRDAYLLSLPEAERARLSRKENEPELTRLWHASVVGANGTNLCSQPDMFERPVLRTIQTGTGWGLDLDDGQGANGAETGGHEVFSSTAGERGIDNQEYRALGCKLEFRGPDGNGGDQLVGMRQFFASGEWTQVILLRGVDSLENDPEVEVIYANTPDRPMADSKGKFLPGSSFTISDTPPRNRNVLRGKIENGVLTTSAHDIVLTQTWGQGGARDIRGNRTKWNFLRGKLRLTFQPDGSLQGLVGGYRPVFDPIQSPAIGGIGSPLTAGIDCAAELATLRKLADGLRNPKTGKCEGVSTAMRVSAIPAFVNDVPQPRQRSAAR